MSQIRMGSLKLGERVIELKTSDWVIIGKEKVILKKNHHIAKDISQEQKIGD